MNYLQALEKKGIKITDLPKSTQKEISELENLSSLKKEFEGVELDNEEMKKLADINLSIKFLEESAVRKINRFDPEKYAKKLEKVKMMNRSRGTEKPKETPKEEKVSKETPKEEKVSKVIQFDEQKVQKNLDQVKKSVQVEPKKFEVEENEVENEPEVEEFSKAESVKPKNKKRMGFFWLGLGMLLSIYGAKNIFSKD